MSSTLPGLGAIVQECRGRVLAALTTRVGDLDLAEDALQDACERALSRWTRESLPANPAGWLYRAAYRRAIDIIRRDQTFVEKRALLVPLADHAELPQDVDDDFPDERLRLIFTCCHPALTETARIALTLKTLGRLSTADIARAFLVPETTMAQRLVRAKRKIQAARIPYQVPDAGMWPERLGSVLAVVYLIFNEGYAASDGAHPIRHELADEAIRLGRVLVTLLPGDAECQGLLALMLLHDARRRARSKADGQLVTLEHQDRTRWDRAMIAQGLGALAQAEAAQQAPGPYYLQALISAEHVRAPSFASTDWERIARAYDQLYALKPTPVVRINGAVALSYAHDANTGLRALQPLVNNPAVADYQPFHAAHADLLSRAGKRQEAIAAYQRAANLSNSDAERQFLTARWEELARLKTP